MRERRSQVRALFDLLAGLSPEEAEAQLAREPDPDVRHAVRELLAADAATNPILDSTPDQLAGALGARPEDSFDALIGRTIGRYRIESLVGAGGMGAVFLAERDDLGMRVALKLLRGALGDPVRIARFEQEQRVLARLSHPYIAQILDAGVAADGTPYLAMAYVDGEAITTWCTQRLLSLEDRLRLFGNLCEAVAFAHGNLIVHRDLKPSNVLVTGDGVVQLLDFGVAKFIDEDLDRPGLTQTGVRVVSPEYAAPEQVLGGAITTATDVYGLGLILYELVTGARPYARGETQHARLFQAVLHDEPRRPSAELPIRPASAADLDAICLKALAKNPTERYRAVSAMQEDVERFLERRPVSARLPTLGYRLGKFLRRNQARVAIAGLAAALVLVASGAFVWQAYQANVALGEARDLSAFLLRVFQSHDPAETRGTDMPLKSFLDLGSVYVEDLRERPALQGRTLEVLSLGYLEIGEYERAEELASQSLQRRRALGVGFEAEVASSLRAQGRSMLAAQNLTGAEDVLRTALALQRQVLGDDHSETSATMLLLAEAIRDQGELEEAHALAREALSRRLRVRRPGDEEGIVVAMTGLARVLALNGRRSLEAEDLLRKGLDIRERLYGPDDFRVEPSVAALGAFLDNLERGEEAAQLASRSLTMRVRVYGEGHPRVLAGLNALASAYLTQGHPQVARELFREVVRRCEVAYGGDHLMLALAMEKVGRTFLFQAQYDSAEVHLRGALGMRLRLEGEEDPDVAALHHALGDVEARLGRPGEAEASLRRAIRQRARFFGAEGPPTLRSEALLGSVLTDLGRSREAEGLLRRVVQVQQEVLGEPHSDLVESLGFLGRALREEGRWEEAEDAYAQSLLIARTGRPVAHPLRAGASQAIQDFYRAWGRPREAERIAREEAGSLRHGFELHPASVV